MVTERRVRDWLDAYVEAWRSYDPDRIGDLFTPDASYAYHPWEDPVVGREAIVASWLSDRDPAGSWEADYHPVLIDGDIAAVRGRTRYRNGAVYDNLWLVEFGAGGRCSRFVEWYVKRPDAGD